MLERLVGFLPGWQQGFLVLVGTLFAGFVSARLVAVVVDPTLTVYGLLGGAFAALFGSFRLLDGR